MDFTKLSDESFSILADQAATKRFSHSFNVLNDDEATFRMMNSIKPDFSWNEAATKVVATIYDNDGVGTSVEADDYKTAVWRLAILIELAASDIDYVLSGKKKIDDDEHSRRLDACIAFFTKTQTENKLGSIWSIFKGKNGEYMDEEELSSYLGEPISILPGLDEKVTTLEYNGGWGTSGKAELPQNPTILDLWKAADALIRQSGDAHHLYVEAFPRKGETSISMICGS